MTGRKKRKLISRIDSESEEYDAEDLIFSHSLDELKALQRKIDSTFADDSMQRTSK